MDEVGVRGVKENRRAICQNVLQFVNEDPEFLNNEAIRDETWAFEYDLETKQHNSK